MEGLASPPIAEYTNSEQLLWLHFSCDGKMVQRDSVEEFVSFEQVPA